MVGVEGDGAFFKCCGMGGNDDDMIACVYDAVIVDCCVVRFVLEVVLFPANFVGASVV